MAKNAYTPRPIIPNPVVPKVWCNHGWCQATRENVPRDEARNWKCDEHRAPQAPIETSPTTSALSEDPSYVIAGSRPTLGERVTFKGKRYLTVSVGALGCKIRTGGGKPKAVEYRELTWQTPSGEVIVGSLVKEA